MSQTIPISAHVQVGSPKNTRAEDYALQKVQITSFIRHILEQYRFGFQILAEFIQNADDAKAHSIEISVDERSHPANTLPGQETADLMGPALCVYNNETFSDQDFQNITNTGDSSKRKDASKTGRFCLGINTAFHVGDCILLVTGSRMVAFDPTRRYFPDPLLVEFGANNHQFADEYPDFCKPFLEYGISFRESFPGTLFRIPLRKQAPPGTLSRQVYSAQELWTELLDDFCEQVPPCLLFLRSVQSISVHSIDSDGVRKEVCRAEVEAEKSQDFLANRTKIFQQLLARHGSEKPKVAEFQSRCRAMRDAGELPAQVDWVHLTAWRCSRLSKKRTVVETKSSWLLSTRVAGGSALAVGAEDADALEDRRIPLVQVAACMELGGALLPRVEGRAHVALPLLDEAFHGMHANLFADTTPDRRKLLRSQERHVTAWLHALMQDGCAAAASDMIARIAAIMAPESAAAMAALMDDDAVEEEGPAGSASSDSDSDGSWEAVGRRRAAGPVGARKEAEVPGWYSLFPILDDTTQDRVTLLLHKTIYQRLWAAAVLLGAGVGGAALCMPSEAVYVDAQKVPPHVAVVLGHVMRLAGRRRLVQPSERMVRGFKAAGVPLEAVTPHMVVSALHDPTPELRELMTRSRDAHVACLGYILRDSKASRRLPGAWAVLSLDGSLRMLPATRSAAWVSSESGNSTDSDGSAQAARERQSSTGDELYIASEEQKELVGGAAGPLGASVLAIREDVLHKRLVVRLSRCAGVLSLSKSAEALCKVIPKLLPPHWLHRSSVRTSPGLSASSSPPLRQHLHAVDDASGSDDAVWVSMDRIGALWRHLGTFADLSAHHLSGVGPILPTSCGKLLAVDSTSWFDVADLAFVSAEELQLLVRMGVLLVDCEQHCIPRQVRKLKRAATTVVEEMHPAAQALSEKGVDEASIEAAAVLSILAKLHARTRLSHDQLEKVRTWPILEVEDVGGGRRLVRCGESEALHDCSDAVDHRLVAGGQFLVPGERSKEAHALLRAVGVAWVEEAELYERFLLPSLTGGASMLREVGVLCDFLAETLPRVEFSSAVPGLVAKLSDKPFIPSADPDAPLLCPNDARDATDEQCRVLFPPRRFPCRTIQERSGAMKMLAGMGMRASATEADLDALFPSSWQRNNVINDWSPGADGHPSCAQVYAAWVLCSDSLRGSAWAVTSAGRLIKGAMCCELLPRTLPHEWPEGFTTRLGLETVMNDPGCDFAKHDPPGGFLPVTPESLLALLSADRKWTEGMQELTADDKDLLREFLMRPLGSRAIAHVGSQQEADSCAVVSIEGRLLARAAAMRQICLLPIHKEVALNAQTGSVEVQYSPLVTGGVRRPRAGGERLRAAHEDEDEDAASVEELLSFHAGWVLLRESVWRGQSQLPSGTLGLSGRRFVCFEELSGWFYREAGVQEVCSVSELYAELVVQGQGFASLPAEEQQRHVAFIRERRLLDGSEMGRALAAPLRSLPVQADAEGVMRRASDLVDCRVPELSTIFASKAAASTSGPWLLPKATAKDKTVVAFLEQLGLRRGVDDFEFLVTCARALGRIATAWSKERAADGDQSSRSLRASGVSESQLVDAGLFLFEALGRFKDQESMLAQVGRIPFVPVFLSKRPYSFRPPSGSPLAAVKDLAPPSLSSVHCLVRPTLHPDIESVPKAVQNLLWPHGELDHDSEIVCTIQQLRRLVELIGDMGGEAGAERGPRRHLKELEELVAECYASLDEAVKRKDALLNNLSLVHDELVKFPSVYLQAAHAFVRPDQVFAAVPASVGGLLFALDSRMQTWPALVAELGIKDRPARIQWLAMLKTLMGRPPSPASAAACVDLLQAIARDGELVGNTAFLNELVAPDSGHVLRPLHALLVNDAPWLLPRIAPAARIHIVHRKLGGSLPLARTLRLRTLSDAVQETADEADANGEGGMAAAEEVDGAAVPAARLLRGLRGREVRGEGSPLRHRLLWLLDLQMSEPSQLGDDGTGDDGGGPCGVDGARVCELLEGMPERMVQVERIVSRFELLHASSVPPAPAGEGAAKQREQWKRGLTPCDVTNAATRSDSMLLWSRGSDAVHVARWLLQVPSVLHGKLAGALNKALDGALNERTERVLGSLLACEDRQHMDDTLTQLQLHATDEQQSAGQGQGQQQPGECTRIPKDLLAKDEEECVPGAELSRRAKLSLTRDKPPPAAITVGDTVAVGSATNQDADLVVAEVVAVYRFLGLATVHVGAEAQRVVLLGRDVWWYRAGAEEEHTVEEREGESEESAGEETADSREEGQEEACDAREEAAGAEPAEEEEEASRPDASAKLKEIRDEIASYKVRLEEEKARKMRVYERQVQAEFKDGMKRMLKRLLLRWHPDKLRSQAQERQAGAAAGTGGGHSVEQTEEYLKDIAQELNRIMLQYSQE